MGQGLRHNLSGIKYIKGNEGLNQMFLGRKAVLVLLVLFLTLTQTVYAEEVKVGTVINKVLSTDIKAFVNGYQIPSMNIDGHTVMVAENLRNYGFDVVWNLGDRSLRITENLLKGLKPVVIESTDHEETGKLLGDVLYTDIKTYVGNREVQSYNIGGYTTLLIRELEEWGSVTWDEDKREVRFISDNLSSLTEAKNGYDFSFRIDKLSEVQMALENKGTKYYYNGKEAGFHDRAAMLSLKTLAQEFGYVYSYDNGYFTVQKGSYSFRIRGNDKKAQYFFDGKPFKERELWHQPIVINNDLFVSDVDLTELFGLDNREVKLCISVSYQIDQLKGKED
ncbi:MAG: hypothetical protein HPY66_2723 [Firmicutes bacterium]|nr:hypothetical protein [Bacillota bacterium]